MVTLALLAACSVDPAPADLDGLLKWFWSGYVTREDAELAQGVVNLEAVLDPAALQEAPLSGELTRLSVEEADVVERDTSQDPARARGGYIVTSLDCQLGQVERIVSDLDQNTLYEEPYHDYERVYLTDHAAYFDRRAPTLDWRSEIWSDVTGLGDDYHEEVLAGLRYVAATPAVLSHTWMPAPAEFLEKDPEDYYWTQDYQIDVFWEHEDRVLHAYGFWRELGLGALDTESDGVLSILLNGLLDWDVRTEELCQEGYGL